MILGRAIQSRGRSNKLGIDWPGSKVMCVENRCSFWKPYCERKELAIKDYKKCGPEVQKRAPKDISWRKWVDLLSIREGGGGGMERSFHCP